MSSNLVITQDKLFEENDLEFWRFGSLYVRIISDAILKYNQLINSALNLIICVKLISYVI